MFKGTKKMWKGIALLLALAMIPTAAFAEDEVIDGNSGTSVAITEAKYAVVGENTVVTVKGTISDENADVTILALRTSAEVAEGTLATYGDTELQRDVVYIDQEAFEGGNFTFEFIPRSGVKGNTITIFVGGEGVTELDSDKIEGLAMDAPVLVPVEPWYLGEDLKLNLRKVSDQNADYANGVADGINAWVTVAQGGTVAVTGGAGTAGTIGHEDGATVITIPGVTATKDDQITNIVITDTTGEYKEATLSKSVYQVAKPHGTLTPNATEVVDGTEVTFTAAGSDDWAKALDDADTTITVLADGEAVACDNITPSETGVAVTFPKVAKGSVVYSLKVENALYETYPSTGTGSTVTVESPTKADFDEVVAPTVEYGGSAGHYTEADGYDENDPKVDELYGKPVLVGAEDATGTNGSDITWVIKDADGAEVTEIERSADGALSYTATVTVAKEGYDPETFDFPFTTNQIGISGVEVTITLTMPDGTTDAVDANIVKVNGVEATTTDKLAFVALMNEGDNTVELSNVHGYVTRTFKVNIVASTETVTLVTPTGKTVIGTVEGKNVTVAMVPGDATGEGEVTMSDFDEWLSKINSTKGDGDYVEAVDFNGDEEVTMTDFDLWLMNINHDENEYK